MSSLGPGGAVPGQHQNGQSQDIPSEYAPQRTVSKSPSLLNLSFLKSLGNTNKKTTRDGQAPKRRGPKPDSKPAMTRRQELNRQAQRTHRERKEQYIRALETELSRLRESYNNDIATANISLGQHRDALQDQKDETVILKEILVAHGIQFEGELERRKATMQANAQKSAVSSSTPQSQSFSHTGFQSFVGSGPLFNTPPTTVSATSPTSDVTDPLIGQAMPYGSLPTSGASASRLDHPGSLEIPDSSPFGGAEPPVPDTPGIFEKEPQLGIDFILTLEQSCRDHLEMLCRGAHEKEEQDMVCGHALMASCPPPTQISNTQPGQIQTKQTYSLPHVNLNNLLNLSRQLVTDGEITPIMALQNLKSHNMYHLLTADDIRHMIDDLNAKIRCYGFGAVMEDFEFMDSLNSVLSSKMEPYVGGTMPLPPTQPPKAEDGMYS